MLGIGALGQYALAQFPSIGAGVTGHAWRRLLAEMEPGARLNRDAPPWMVWAEEDEEAVILALML